jgi:AcrR family transcriptional regulator
MDAAYDLLVARKGESLSVTDVLQATGLATRAFYRHFESKDALLLALYRRDSERFLTELEADAAAAGSPGEALIGWINGMLRIAAQPRRRQRAVVLSASAVLKAAGFEEEHAWFKDAHENGIVRILERGRADNSFAWADPTADARAIRAMLWQAFHDQMTGRAGISAAQAQAEVVSFAFRALGAATPLRPPSAPTAAIDQWSPTFSEGAPEAFEPGFRSEYNK